MTARLPHRTASGDLELQDNETIGFRVPHASIFISGKDAGELPAGLHRFLPETVCFKTMPVAI